jgi:holo-[acyl-carrier protein] synthase
MLSSPEEDVRLRARTGCDLQSVDEVADAVRAFGERYLDRVYTPAEQADCRARGPLAMPRSLAARWAAKEAVLKLIGTGDGVDPRTIEVRGQGGPVRVSLTGRAAELAATAALGPIEVSLSHTRDLAMAVAVAVVDPTTAPTTQSHRNTEEP